MNQISCYKDCKYQQDGYCYLNSNAKPSDSAEADCRFYREKKNEETNFFNS